MKMSDLEKLLAKINQNTDKLAELNAKIEKVAANLIKRIEKIDRETNSSVKRFYDNLESVQNGIRGQITGIEKLIDQSAKNLKEKISSVKEDAEKDDQYIIKQVQVYYEELTEIKSEIKSIKQLVGISVKRMEKIIANSVDKEKFKYTLISIEKVLDDLRGQIDNLKKGYGKIIAEKEAADNFLERNKKVLGITAAILSIIVTAITLIIKLG